MIKSGKISIIKTISFKLFFIILLLSLIIFTVFTYISVRLQNQNLMDAFLSSAQRIGDVIKNSTRYSMLLNRREDVYEIMRTIGKEQEVEGIRLYNKKGEIMFSTNPREINTTVDMKAEACYICHNEQGLIKDVSNPKRSRTFISPDGSRVLGLIEPIKNEPDCSTSECHAHPSDKTILGVLDVKLSLSKLDQSVSTSTNSLVLMSIVVIIVILILVSILIRYFIHIPINKLYIGTKEIAAGNLDHAIDINVKNEIGILANSFNKMTGDLKKARDEITDWSDTLEKKVEEKSNELKMAQSQIDKIEKMASLGKLSATVAHELNNPLAGMLNYTKLIMKRFTNKEITKESVERSLTDLNIIANEIQRLGNIVKNLLVFSKQKESDYTKDNIQTIITSSIDLIRHHLEVNNIKLITKYEVDDYEIICDPQQIKQALIALFINASEAMCNGGILTVVLNFNKTTEHYTLEISDTGIGIDKEDIAHVFEPFYTTKVDGKGVGLGLAVVYGIIEKHKGTIEAISEKNKGTTFMIKLPKHSELNRKNN